MSRAGDEEDKDENECFHDSLDRLLSCSNTSCSCSPSNSDCEDDDCGPSSASSSDDTGTVPKFPLGVSRNFDVWVSQPSSVEDRRLHLLRQMGLTGDPTLLRHRPSLSFSLSPYHLLNPLGETCCSTNSSNSKTVDNNSNCVKGCDDSSDCDGTAFGMVRSKSDEQCDSRRTFRAQSDGTVSGGTGVHVNNEDKGKNIQRHSSAERSSSSNISLDTCTVSPNKLSEVKSINYGSNHNRSFSDTHAPFARDEEFCSLDRDGLGDVKSLCKIKNLNNGKEFVVNETREDGTWKKIKEVGIGHHLMMDDLSSEMYVGTSPIVQELMRRQHFEDRNKDGLDSNKDGGVSKSKKRGSWLKNMKNVANSITGHKERSSDERDTSSEKGGTRSSSATDDSQDVSFHGFERVRVKHYGKSVKELTSLYKSQEIRAHNGSIWAVQFSLDGKYLASAGEDSVIQVWQVVETESKEDFFFHKLEDGNFNLLFPGNGLPEQSSMSPNLDGHPEKKKIRRRLSISRKSMSFEQILVPETVFGLSEKPLCSFHGHLDDVLDLAWSKSLQLLSSSMDKTVRLWDLSSKSCLKIFSHSDYVTCIQFNPVDDRYFISGSLDAKVRIWSIPDRKVVDWNDLHEMVTAACYTPDGQGALVGSYKGSCCLYNISENKLLRKCQINLQNRKKKSHQKKITGFQFAPGSASEVLVTSADSRVRVIDGVDFVHKFKGFHNTNSQISASLTSNGKYIISASEDSYVYVWRHEAESRPNRTKGVTMTQTYEYFHCQDVSVAIPWPGPSDKWAIQDSPARGLNGSYHQFEDSYTECHLPTVAGETNCSEGPSLGPLFTDSPLNGPLSCAPNSYFFDKMSMTWPEEKLPQASLKNRSPRVSIDFSNGLYHQNRSAWGMVIVTAGLKGEIKIFQNFGLPMRT